MEYYPSKYEIEMHKFFDKRKIALNTIEKLGLPMPYISASLTFEQLFLEYAVKDITNNETDYLKQGIQSLIECLKAVKNQPLLTREEAEKVIREKHKDRIGLKPSDENQNKSREKWINDRTTDLIQSEKSSKKTTEDVLIREIAEFKTRLGRVNVVVEINNDVLKFNNENKMQKLTISYKEIKENPFPLIFKDADAYAFFIDLHDVFCQTDKGVADYSFIYRKMFDDGLIIKTCGPERFRKLVINEPFNVESVEPKIIGISRAFSKQKEAFYKKLKSMQ